MARAAGAVARAPDPGRRRLEHVAVGDRVQAADAQVGNPDRASVSAVLEPVADGVAEADLKLGRGHNE